YAEIIVVVSIGRTIVQYPYRHIEIAEVDHAGIYRFATGNGPAAKLVELIFKIQLGAVEALGIVGSLETKTNRMQTVFIQPFMIGSGDSKKIGGKYTIG